MTDVRFGLVLVVEAVGIVVADEEIASSWFVGEALG